MNRLKVELERKRKAMESAEKGDNSNSSAGEEPAPKYMKRSEWDRLRDASRSSSIDPSSKPQSPSASLQPSPAPEASGSKSVSSSNAAAVDEALLAETGGKFNISNEECVRRLRSKGQPIRLFAESDKDRRSRLRALELMDAHAAGSGVGQRNDLMRALEDMDRGEVLAQLAKRGKVNDASLPDARQGGSVGGPGSRTEGKDSDGATEETSDSKDKVREDGETPVDVSLAKKNPHKLYPQIYFCFKKILREWEAYMADRPESVKRSTQGKLAAATQKQSAEYLKPLFKALRKRDLEPDVLVLLAEIAHRIQTREYLRANDAYLKLSIGNAPWPIGVTMVGIHERSAREKIGSNQANQVAHVLNDEVSRKYIQSLKRLMTFSQSYRPPADLSQLMG